MYRDLVNVRNPKLLPEKYLNIQDEFLKEYNHDIVNFNDLSPIKNNSQLYLFQGDITTLKIDGIVNAANSDLLGCFIKENTGSITLFKQKQACSYVKYCLKL